MVSFNPMFNDRKEKNIKTEPVQAQQVRKVRKVRSDKKKDIRIPLSLEAKQLIKKLSFQYNTYPTVLTTDILTEALYRMNEFDDVEYPQSSHKVVAKIDQETFIQLQNYCIQWDCSIRKAAHRVIVNSLRKEGHLI
ncbi:hypothetical protein COJ46_01420 [Bacillus sp. AFS077874]|uniref:hypothetical protein n=1 Tax=unclassified Bacillus (in: firmicutes) TaxID=185979 RepID=UPI000BECBF16|nr:MULTISPECIES: hypothetical protein [unclassified Bacillus (in: firmicutes)]PEC50905.1 hypothetical protein CON00_04105 [Bacillus sp. AFS096315]PFM83207.1 hypothetical protein COJ46_01420 [Bacillus sp. AFS077874]